MIVGNWATLLLATDRSGRIDMKKMSDEIDTLIASRPCGIYSNGTACEFYTLSREEFMQISLLLSEKCEASSVPYQIGVSHMSPQESLERLRLVRDLHPGAVQVILPDMEGALELEKRIQAFMSECIDPFIVKMHYPNHACDRFMALVGGWADMGPALRWPYESIPETYVASVRRRAHEIIPEFVD